MSSTPNLDQFIEAETDDARLALGLDVLRAAYSEAERGDLAGWSDSIFEFIHALESGHGLNRPLT